MILNHTKLGPTYTFMKDSGTVFSLSFLPKSLIWKKMAFFASNLLNLAELAVNQQKKTTSRTIYQYSNLHTIDHRLL